MSLKNIYCCGCEHDVSARLTDGAEVYPNRPDLSQIPFWKCDGCQNFVGCHYKTKTPTKPLGVIPTYELKKARRHIHEILDPIWKNNHMPRGKLYHELNAALGVPNYHTAEIRTIEFARQVYKEVLVIRKDLGIA